MGSDVELAAAKEFFKTLNQNASIELYKSIEDLSQIPYHEEMGQANRTVLRCSDGCFKINYSDMNDLKVATMKQMRSANQAMI